MVYVYGCLDQSSFQSLLLFALGEVWMLKGVCYVLLQEIDVPA